MDHDITLITTVAAGFGLALVLGVLAERLRVPALVGYLLAGIAIGPSTPGFVADMAIASQLAEIGVMLLMFGVGLHFSLADLMAVRRIAVPGAVVQMGLATALGMALAWAWGWPPGAGLVFGLSLSVASTVVLLKALESRRLLDTMNGRIAVGWLVVEDLATVLMLVLLPPLVGVLGGTAAPNPDGHPLWRTIAQTLLQVVAFVAIMLVAGRRVLPWLLWQVAKTGSRELFTLAVVAAAISIAYGASALFGVSFALGAFFAGMVMRESEYGHRAAEQSLPLRDAFAVLFFVSVGMLFQPAVLVDQPLRVLAVVAIIVLGKSLAAAVLVLSLRYPLNTALTVAASLGQIGEFSFILAGMGLALGLLPPEGMSLVLAGALISIAINPLVFAAVPPLRRWVLRHSATARRLEQRDDPLAALPMDTGAQHLQGQVVLVGHGQLGQRIAQALRERGIAHVIADQNRALVDELRRSGQAAVCGDAADPAVLIQAHIAKAAMLVVATADTLGVQQMVQTARTLNPGIEVVLRAHSAEECQLLRQEALGAVFVGEDELARGMAGHVLARFDRPARKTETPA